MRFVCEVDAAEEVCFFAVGFFAVVLRPLVAVLVFALAVVVFDGFVVVVLFLFRLVFAALGVGFGLNPVAQFGTVSVSSSYSSIGSCCLVITWTPPIPTPDPPVRSFLVVPIVAVGVNGSPRRRDWFARCQISLPNRSAGGGADSRFDTDAAVARLFFRSTTPATVAVLDAIASRSFCRRLIRSVFHQLSSVVWGNADTGFGREGCDGCNVRSLDLCFEILLVCIPLELVEMSVPMTGLGTLAVPSDCNGEKLSVIRLGRCGDGDGNEVEA